MTRRGQSASDAASSTSATITQVRYAASARVAATAAARGATSSTTRTRAPSDAKRPAPAAPMPDPAPVDCDVAVRCASTLHSFVASGTASRGGTGRSCLRRRHRSAELDRDFLDELERLFPGPGVVPESLPGDGYRPGTDTRLLCRLKLV
jgi:hypothetical protein